MTIDTSAEALAFHNSAYWRVKIYDLMLMKGGKVSLWEAAAYFGKEKNTLSGRFTELQRRGLIVDSGKRSTDPATGRKARIYEVVNSCVRLRG